MEGQLRPAREQMEMEMEMGMGMGMGGAPLQGDAGQQRGAGQPGQRW
eukprot:COSAG02_NODE_44643_length_364_cov_0.969811_1_plen_46_part_01